MSVRGTQGACPATARSLRPRSLGGCGHVGAGHPGACAPTARSTPDLTTASRALGAWPPCFCGAGEGLCSNHAFAGRFPPVISVRGSDPVPRDIRRHSPVNMVVCYYHSESSAQEPQTDRGVHTSASKPVDGIWRWERASWTAARAPGPSSRVCRLAASPNC